MKRLAAILLMLAGCAPQQQVPAGPASLQIIPASYYSTYYVPVRKRGRVVRVERRVVRVVVEQGKPPVVEPIEDSEGRRRREKIQWYADYIAGEVEKLRRDLGKGAN